MVSLGDRVCAETFAVSSCDASSNGLVVYLWEDTYNNCLAFLFAHAPLNIPVNDLVVHRLCFYQPWLRNIAAMFGALLCYCSSMQAKDLSGNVFNIKNSSFVQSQAKILLGYGTNPFSFDDYQLTDPVELDTLINAVDGGTFYTIHIYAFYTPPADETIYEVGLKIGVTDTGGAGHDVLILRHVNPNGYPLRGGTEYMIEILIHGE